MPLSVLKRDPVSSFRAAISGNVELVVDAQHFQKIVLEGILKAEVSIDVMTADFKAMLVPDRVTMRARSIVQVFRQLANRGVEIRLLHAGVPSSAALRDLKPGWSSGAARSGFLVMSPPIRQR